MHAQVRIYVLKHTQSSNPAPLVVLDWKNDVLLCIKLRLEAAQNKSSLNSSLRAYAMNRRPNRKPKTEWRQLERGGDGERKRQGRERRGKEGGWVQREQNGINWSWSGALHSEEAGFAYLCSGAEGEMCRCWQQAEYLKPPLTPLQALSPHVLWYTVEGTQSHTHTHTRFKVRRWEALCIALFLHSDVQ